MNRRPVTEPALAAGLLAFLFLYVALAAGCVGSDMGAERSGESDSRSTEADTGAGVPQRIVSMSPNLTQIVFALGAGGRLVGVDEYSVYPEAAKKLPRMGSYLDPNIEELIAARPDLVLLAASDERLKELLDSAGLRYEAFRNDSVSEVTANIERLGELLQCQRTSAWLIRVFETCRNGIEQSLAGVEPVKVALVVGRNPGRLQDIYVAGKSSFLGELLSMAGGENVFGDLEVAWPLVGVEAIIARNPDVIIDSTLSKGATDPEFEALARDWDALTTVNAVRNGRVIVPREGWWQIPGAYMGSALRLFAHWLHPDLFPEGVTDPNTDFQFPQPQEQAESNE